MIPVVQPRLDSNPPSRVVDRWLPGWNIFTYVIPNAKSARASVSPVQFPKATHPWGIGCTLPSFGGLKWSEWSLRYQGYRGHICWWC